MTTKIFPGTTTAYTKLPVTPGGQFAPILRAHGESGPDMASLNAGDPGLYVGGGTINLAFEKQIGPTAALYGPIHRAALKAANAGTMTTTSFAAGAPVRFVGVRLPGSAAPQSALPAETCFLDVFIHAPHGEPSNYAMLYAVPPNGHNTPYYASDSDFLAAVTRTAVNAVALLAEYNTSWVAANSGLAAIPLLRTCLFSGGQFRPRTLQPDDVAKAIFAGFTQALVAAGSGCGLATVEFENGNHEFSSLP